MARFQIKHGENIEVATLSEIQALLAEQRAEDRRARLRVRAAETVALDGGGNGAAVVYSVPPGFEFEARRVSFSIDGSNDPGAGNIQLNNAPAKYIAYQRSGTIIEYAAPIVNPGNVPQVPGTQTWGAEQGPYLVNAETFEIRARGIAVNVNLLCLVEGILTRVRAQ